MDMLVKLYDLPPVGPVFQRLESEYIEIRRSLAPEKHRTIAWVGEKFSESWASETDVAFSRLPISCFVALKEDRMMGFACHDTTCRGFFGPTGVAAEDRNKGIGTALLFACLEDMKYQGFGYAIIGGVGPAQYYAKTVHAVPIEGSEPGVYRGLIGSSRFGQAASSKL
jgi:acetyltransferase (GNAT) family protein